MTLRREKNKGIRKEEILIAAAKLAERVGYQNVKRESLAREIGCSASLLSYHFGTMDQLRRGIMRHAIRCNLLTIVAQGLVVGDPHAKKVPDNIKREALASLT